MYGNNNYHEPLWFSGGIVSLAVCSCQSRGLPWQRECRLRLASFSSPVSTDQPLYRLHHRDVIENCR